MIVTFYSYKGGVGRTLALANIACLMSGDVEHPQKVLVWDFDLEAPSLHKLFPPKKPQNYGFVDFVHSYAKTGKVPDINEYIYESEVPNVYVLPASGKIDDSYCNKLQEINWLSFFGSNPKEKGSFFETILDSLNSSEGDAAFDYVLVDSRTGLNDQAGICTEILPDLLIILFRLSEQNFDGLDHLVPAIKSQLKARNKEEVSILPIASQVGLATTQDSVNKYRRHAEEIFQNELYYTRFDQDLVNNERLLCLPEKIKELWPTPPIIEDYNNICQKIRVKNENDSRTQEKRLSKLLRNDDDTTAIQLIKKLLRKRPSLSRPWQALFEHEVSPGQSDQDEIKKIVDDIIARYDNNHFAFKWYGEYHLDRAQDTSSKELQKAIEKFQKALECTFDSKSEQVSVLRKLSKIKSSLGDLEEAIELLKKAKNIFPENNQIGLDLSFLYVRKGSNYFALACQELQSISDRILYTNGYLAYLHAYLGEKEKASQCLERLEKGNRDPELLNLQKAYVLLLEGEKEEALKLVPKNISMSDDVANWLEFYLSSMEFNKALGLIDKVQAKHGSKKSKAKYKHIELLIKFFNKSTKVKKEDIIEEWRGYSGWNFRELIFFKESCLKKRLPLKQKLDVIDTLLMNQDFDDLKQPYRHGRFRRSFQINIES